MRTIKSIHFEKGLLCQSALYLRTPSFSPDPPPRKIRPNTVRNNQRGQEEQLCQLERRANSDHPCEGGFLQSNCSGPVSVDRRARNTASTKRKTPKIWSGTRSSAAATRGRLFFGVTDISDGRSVGAAQHAQCLHQVFDRNPVHGHVYRRTMKLQPCLGDVGHVSITKTVWFSVRARGAPLHSPVLRFG